MPRGFWRFLLLACEILAIVLVAVWYFNKPAQLRLTGSITKVRTYKTGPDSTLVVADFHITNPSGVPFVVNSLGLTLDTAGGDTVESKTLSKSEIAEAFRYATVLGPQTNQPLSVQDRVPPGQTEDRMTAAAFDLPHTDVAARKALRIKIEELDGIVAEITERK
jgi:hypothetical protein